jgi:hypothetical protein
MIAQFRQRRLRRFGALRNVSHIRSQRTLLIGGDIRRHPKELFLERRKSLLRWSRLGGGRNCRRGWAHLPLLVVIGRLRAAIIILICQIASALLGNGIDTGLSAGCEARKSRQDDNEVFHRLGLPAKLHPPGAVVNSLRAVQFVQLFADYVPPPHPY